MFIDNLTDIDIAVLRNG